MTFARGRNGQSKSHKTEFREPSERTLVDGVWKSEYLYTFVCLFPEIQAKCFSYNIIPPEVDKVIVACISNDYGKQARHHISRQDIINPDFVTFSYLSCREWKELTGPSVPTLDSAAGNLLKLTYISKLPLSSCSPEATTPTIFCFLRQKILLFENNVDDSANKILILFFVCCLFHVVYLRICFLYYYYVVYRNCYWGWLSWIICK